MKRYYVDNLLINQTYIFGRNVTSWMISTAHLHIVPLCGHVSIDHFPVTVKAQNSGRCHALTLVLVAGAILLLSTLLVIVDYKSSAHWTRNIGLDKKEKDFSLLLTTLTLIFAKGYALLHCGLVYICLVIMTRSNDETCVYKQQ